jgi:hypothetical protein
MSDKRKESKYGMISGLTLAVIMASGAVLPQLGTASANVTPKATFAAQLSGDEEVPPRDTNARGAAIFMLSEDGTALQYTLIVANIDNVMASHIHIAPAGVNGPIVAFLFSGGPTDRVDGVLAQGTITSDDLIGQLAGMTIDDLVAAINSGNAYVNVHTTEFPGGEIRGQIS